MGIASRLELGSLKRLVLRHMKAVAAKGLYVLRNQQLPPSVAKMPAGLARLKKEHELNDVIKPKTLNINFVFEQTIPELANKGVFTSMTEAESDMVIGKIIEFASSSVKRAEEIKMSGGGFEKFHLSIIEFFTKDIIMYAEWIKRKKDIGEIVAFKAGIRSEDAAKRIEAVKRAADIGMTEAAEDIVAGFSESASTAVKADPFRLALIEAMEKLGRTEELMGQLKQMYPCELTAERKEPEVIAQTGSVNGRFGSSMVTGPDGRLYVFGGLGVMSYSRAAIVLHEFFAIDPGTGKLENLKKTFPAALRKEGCTMIHDAQMMARGDGMLYLFGGEMKPQLKYSNLWRYDPAARKWEDIGLEPVAIEPTTAMFLNGISDHSMVCGKDGKMYIFGGRFKNKFIYRERSRIFYAYDPADREWQNLENSVPASLFPRYGHRMAADREGNIYLFGGNGETSKKSKYCYLNDMWKYNPSTGRWTQIMPNDPKSKIKGRAFHTMTLGADGNIYIMGGKCEDDPKHQVMLSDSLMFYPGTRQMKKVDLGGRRTRHSHSVCAGPDGSMYMLGGISLEGDGKMNQVSSSEGSGYLGLPFVKIAFTYDEAKALERIKAKLRGKKNADS